MPTGQLEEIEEERRLFYAALTRAKDRLHVCYPLRYYTHSRSFSDVHGYAQLTRFLGERVRRSFELIAAAEFIAPGGFALLGDAGAEPSSAPVTTEDIRRRPKDFF
jgi:DNA helicase-2/ATP-dependent DNA helicase PcrA